MMTRTEAREWIESHLDDDTLDDAEMVDAFLALYGREPDERDRTDGMWSLLCACDETD